MYLGDSEDNYYDTTNENSNRISIEKHDKSSDTISNESEESEINNLHVHFSLQTYWNTLKKNLFLIFWFFLGFYTNIELYFNPKENKLKQVELINKKDNYYYYQNNKVIATSDNLTNRKNYEFASRIHYTNSDGKFIELVLSYNKIKRKKVSICDKHFMSLYFTINENDYEVKLDDNSENYYLTNNIIDFNVIRFILFDKYNLDISNVPFNLVIIDNESNVVLLKETEFIRMFQKKYVKGTYE